LVPDGSAAIVLMDDPGSVIKIELANRRITSRLQLPAAPGDLDLNGSLAAITIPARNSVLRVSVEGLKLAGTTDTGIPCGPVRFRKDGKTIFAGSTADREIIAIDAQSGRLLTKLPLPVSPSRFCLNAEGGELFVTGKGEDALAIVSSFQNEVEQTILAGRTPFAMAVSSRRNLLFVTNPDSGDLTIIDIDTRKVSASVHVGENPGEILLTPDDEYALVMDRRSGSVSVVRITTVLDHRLKTNSPPSPMFTVFPTAADARSAIIVPFPS
jgi:YVTN family beta-propeller protein